ncbi:hypothetical protein A3860_08895 [Niastella vici]|uniref:Thymidylate kinase-like domain-containing protein n=1 Tax=Niastella vici TaxID=1703345 RepID=A0A1V9FH95_9BACT|nr:hypothetical protein [Niastella vici]OQP57735.1 hypothetical protein A3860_08895 [Niastella vici]
MVLLTDPSVSHSDSGAELSRDHITRESVELLADCKREHLRFAHWKGNSHLLQSLEGRSDIEILVHPNCRLQFEAILRRRSYKKMQSQPRNAYPGIEDWLGFDPDTGRLLHLHTHYDLATKTGKEKFLHLPWLEFFFQQLKIDQLTGWPVPIPEMETLVLLVRIHANMLHDKPVIPIVKQKELQQLLSQVQLQRFREVCSGLQLEVPAGLEVEINNIVQYHSVPAMIHLSAQIYHQLSASIITASPMAAIKTFYYKYFLKFYKHAGRFTGPVQLKKTLLAGGKVIALVGSDGAGKSTLCNDVIKWLTFKIDTHYFYFGKRPFIKSYGWRLFSITAFLFNDRAVSKYFRKLAGNIYYLLLIHKKINMLRLANRLRQKRSLVICDRFPQKDILGFFDGPKLQANTNTWFARLERKQFSLFCQNGADVVFKLQVPPEIAAQRKPEHDNKLIEKKCENLSGISFGHATVIDIDAGRPYEQVLLETKRKLWEVL